MVLVRCAQRLPGQLNFSLIFCVTMPLRSTVVTPFYHYYGLPSPDFNGHFLPSSFIGASPPSLSGFRCSLCSNLAYAALVPIYDPPAVPLPAVGGFGTPFVNCDWFGHQNRKFNDRDWTLFTRAGAFRHHSTFEPYRRWFLVSRRGRFMAPRPT